MAGSSCVNLGMVTGGMPTPLKNDGVRQLGLWNSQYMEKSKPNVPNHQPDSDFAGCGYFHL